MAYSFGVLLAGRSRRASTRMPNVLHKAKSRGAVAAGASRLFYPTGRDRSSANPSATQAFCSMPRRAPTEPNSLYCLRCGLYTFVCVSRIRARREVSPTPAQDGFLVMG